MAQQRSSPVASPLADASDYRLREIREQVTQKELAERMEITQPTISALEAGELDRSGIATLKAYVEALGGTVEVTANFGDRRLVLSSGEEVIHRRIRLRGQAH